MNYDHVNSGSDENYKAHSDNSIFAIKTMLIFLGGGLIANANFISHILTAKNSTDYIFDDVLKSCQLSSQLFLLGLISTLLAVLYTYYSNRYYLLDTKDNNILMMNVSIVFGIIGFFLLLFGLLAIIPAFNALIIN